MPDVKKMPGGENYLVVDPMENIIIGSNNIMAYMGIKSVNTLYQWVELYAFPAIKRPDGMWMTSITSIDQWIFMAAELDNENRPNSRGYSQKLEIARARLDARIKATKEQLERDGRRKTGPIEIQGAREGFDAATKDHSHRVKQTARTIAKNEARKAVT